MVSTITAGIGTCDVWIRGVNLVMHRWNWYRGTPPRKEENAFHSSQYISTDGWCGIPVGEFNRALQRAAGTRRCSAKFGLCVTADGMDWRDELPIVRLVGGTPQKLAVLYRRSCGHERFTCVRPFWAEWGARLRIMYVEDCFSELGIVALVMKAGRKGVFGTGKFDVIREEQEIGNMKQQLERITA